MFVNGVGERLRRDGTSPLSEPERWRSVTAPRAKALATRAENGARHLRGERCDLGDLGARHLVGDQHGRRADREADVDQHAFPAGMRGVGGLEPWWLCLGWCS